MSKTAYDEGFEARARDCKKHDCPYSIKSQNLALWLKGWNDQDRHMAAKESTLGQLYDGRTA
jgi:ribosome modulation factor